jgi:hypothetical protein
MINVKDQVYKAIKDICTNVSDSYPSEWANLPAIQYVEEDNKVYEFTGGKEDKSYIRYKIDIWHNRSTSEFALEVDKRVSALGLRRTLCQDVADPSGLKHKVMRYEGIIDNNTQLVYQ